MNKAFTTYEYLTLYLIDSDVRPACLFFDSEYTNQLEENIKRYFPKLQIYHDSFFGYFVSKNKLKINNNSNSDDIGKILGYPQDSIPYTEIDHNKDVISTHINITMSNNQQISLLDMCSQNSVFDNMTDIMYNMKNKLLLPECIYYNQIININVKEDIHHSIDYYCKKLVKKEELSEDDIYNIYNNIWNIYGDTISNFNYDLKNDMHIGIIITLLLYCKNNPIEQFYGPNYGKCNITKKIIEINKNFSDDIFYYHLFGQEKSQKLKES